MKTSPRPLFVFKKPLYEVKEKASGQQLSINKRKLVQSAKLSQKLIYNTINRLIYNTAGIIRCDSGFLWQNRDLSMCQFLHNFDFVTNFQRNTKAMTQQFIAMTVLLFTKILAARNQKKSKRDFCKIFNHMQPENNVNFIDINFDLNNSTFCPYQNENYKI